MMYLSSLSSLTRILSIIFVVSILLSVVNCSGNSGVNSVSDPIIPAPGELFWSEEFDGTTLDADNWNYDTGYGPAEPGWGNDESQLYTSSADNVGVIASVEGDDAGSGYLYITARCPSGTCVKQDGSITSARITTKDKFEFRYGVAKARIKIPNGRSVWAAFWMLGANFPDTIWPAAGEIDIMETFWTQESNDRIAHFATHWQNPRSIVAGQNLQSATEQTTIASPAPSLSEDFHTYELDWNADRIIGKIDDITYFTQQIDPAEMEEFQRPFFFLLNIAIDGNLGLAPEQIMDTPQTMFVDWIKVYGATVPAPTQPTEAAPTPPIREAANVISVYSDAYTPVGNVDFASFGGTTVTAFDVNDDNILRYNSLNYSGITFDSIDVSGMTHIHFDVWTLDNTGEFRLKLVDFGGTDEVVEPQPEPAISGSTTPALAKGSWTSADIALSSTTVFPGFSGADIKQMVPDAVPDGTTYFVDNIYFYNAAGTVPAPTQPATAAPTPPVRAAEDVISVYSDAYTPVGNVDFPNFNGTTVAAFDISGDNILRYNNLNYSGITFDSIDVTGMTHIHFDVWTPANSGEFRLKLVDFGGTDDVVEPQPEPAISATPSTQGSWASADIALSSSEFFSGFSGADIRQMVPDAVPDGTTYFVDNIYFYNAVTVPVNFEDADLDYAVSDFGEATTAVIDNPQTAGNSSAKVWQMMKGTETLFGGSTLLLGEPIDFTSSETFTMNVWSSRPVPVLLKLEGTSTTEVTIMHGGGSSWETLTFDFTGRTAALGDVEGITVIFDNDVMGDGSAAWTFYLDDIMLVASTTTPRSGDIDGGFESGAFTDAWELTPRGGEVTVSDERANGGTYSAKLTLTAAAAENTVLKLVNYMAGEIEAGDSVTVSFDYLVTAINPGSIFQGRLQVERSVPGASSTHQYNTSGNISEAITTDWVSFTETTIIPSGDASGGISVELNAVTGGAGGTITVYIDNVVVTVN